MANEVEIKYEDVLAETAKAVLLKIDGKKIWMPKSQIRSARDPAVGESGTLTITEWIAVQKELIEEPDQDDDIGRWREEH